MLGANSEHLDSQGMQRGVNLQPAGAHVEHVLKYVACRTPVVEVTTEGHEQLPEAVGQQILQDAQHTRRASSQGGL